MNICYRAADIVRLVTSSALGCVHTYTLRCALCRNKYVNELMVQQFTAPTNKHLDPRCSQQTHHHCNQSYYDFTT